jgi:hypothetical protein
MTFYRFADQVLIPTAIFILLVGALGGIALGCALVFRSAAALRFVTRMNRYVSTRRALKPLEIPRAIEAPVGSPKRRMLGAILAVGGLFTVFFLLWRLDFPHRSPAVTDNVARWLLTGIALDATKWILVTGSSFACLVGILMLFWPQRLAELESVLNRWYSTRRLVPADSENMRVILEPLVEANPRAAGWLISGASLVVTVAMIGLLITRAH